MSASLCRLDTATVEGRQLRASRRNTIANCTRAFATACAFCAPVFNTTRAAEPPPIRLRRHSTIVTGRREELCAANAQYTTLAVPKCCQLRNSVSLAYLFVRPSNVDTASQRVPPTNFLRAYNERPAVQPVPCHSHLWFPWGPGVKRLSLEQPDTPPQPFSFVTPSFSRGSCIVVSPVCVTVTNRSS